MQPTPLTKLRTDLHAGLTTPSRIAEDVIAHANQNASRNTYLHFDAAALRTQANTLNTQAPLHSIPVSLKDCFDLAGTITTAGSRFYAEHNTPATQDSAVAQRLRELGCLLTGKTHLHPLAYGITGENPDYADCLQPNNQTLLTGGSSSGAAASVQEGSALFAIGTDTGGSIRVPAALCGLVGFRASHNITQSWPTMWQGGMHLAPSFDTLGILTRSIADLATLSTTLFQLTTTAAPQHPRIGYVPTSFLHDATSAVLTAYVRFQQQLSHHATLIPVQICHPEPKAKDLLLQPAALWADSLEIFAGIQAHEAATIHRGNFAHFPPLIADRLRWGATITPTQLSEIRARHTSFQQQLATLFQQHDFLILPAAPVHELRSNADHSRIRPIILRYTTPFSLGGNPVVTLPGLNGTGLQIAAAPGHDAQLLAFAASLTETA